MSQLEVLAFSFTGEIKPKIEIKMEKKTQKWSDFGDFQLSEVRKKNGNFFLYFYILLSVCSKENKSIKDLYFISGL
jgi:hypothetical protein